MGAVCTWRHEYDPLGWPIWETQCGETTIFAEGGPRENYYVWCPYCSGRIRVEDETESDILDALAREQGVKPCDHPQALAGGWPGKVDDGFEDAIGELRHGRHEDSAGR